MLYLELFSNPARFEVFGVQLVETQPDLHLIATNELQDIPAAVPVVVLEKYAASTVRPESLRILSTCPNVRAVFKNTWASRTPSLQTVTGRVHFALLNAAHRLELPEATLDRTYDARIRQVTWNLHYSPYCDVFLTRLRDHLPPKTRRVNACFTCHPGAPLQVHREQVRQQALRLGADIAVVSKSHYDEILRKTQVAISPWGFGEYCMRDYEAIMAGAAIVKPLPYAIQDDTGLYALTGPIVPCQVDFSDLESAIQQALQPDPVRQAQSQRLRSQILETSRDQLIQRLCQALLQAYEEPGL
jgi:hypothetical protein